MPHPQDRPSRDALPPDEARRILAAAERAWRRGDGTVIVQVSTKPDGRRFVRAQPLAPDDSAS